MKIIIFTILLSASINVGFTQSKIKANTQSIESLKVPDFKDPQVKAYFNWHRSHVIKYVKAVRENNKPAIKGVFEEGISKAKESEAIIKKAESSGTVEYKKLQEYSRQVSSLMQEVSKSAYVQQLTKEYMGKTKN
jgi:hypothetical protein